MERNGPDSKSFQRYNCLNPRDQHVPFRPTVKEISVRTEIIHLQGEYDNVADTAKKREFSKKLLVARWIRIKKYVEWQTRRRSADFV